MFLFFGKIKIYFGYKKIKWIDFIKYNVFLEIGGVWSWRVMIRVGY